MIYIGSRTQVYTPVGMVHGVSGVWKGMIISIHSVTGDIAGGPVRALYSGFILSEVFSIGWNKTINDYDTVYSSIYPLRTRPVVK